MSKKPWLLLSQAEKDAFTQEIPEDRSLLAASLHASSMKNEELRKEIKQLRAVIARTKIMQPSYGKKPND